MNQNVSQKSWKSFVDDQTTFAAFYLKILNLESVNEVWLNVLFLTANAANPASMAPTLTLFRMGGQKAPPPLPHYQFFPCNFYRRGN